MLNSPLGINVCVQSLSLKLSSFNHFPHVDILLIVLQQCKLGNRGCVGKLNTLLDGSHLFYIFLRI